MTDRREIIYIDCTSSEEEASEEEELEEELEGDSEEGCLTPCFPAYTCEWCMSHVPDVPRPNLEVFFRFEMEYGRSLKTTAPIEAGEYIADYKGKRLLKYRGGPYVMEVIKGKMWIDGAVGGNISCWINHSCAPNCEVYVEPLTHRAMIFALKRIEAEEELTFRYSDDLYDLPFDCQCEVCMAESGSEGE